MRFDRGGKVTASSGATAATEPGQFVEPVGLAADAVRATSTWRTPATTASRSSTRTGSSCASSRCFGWKDFYTEPYLASGPPTAVLVTDSWKGRIAHYDASGGLVRSFKADGIKRPTGIALDRFGRVVVSDRDTNRIFSWSLADLMR